MIHGSIHMGDDLKKTKIDREIEANLKRAYSDLLDEDVPERFKLLLEELREKGSKS